MDKKQSQVTFPRFKDMSFLIKDLFPDLPELLLAEGKRLDAVELFGPAAYVPSLNTVYLSNDNIESIVHELCERDTQRLLEGVHAIQTTTVSHLLSPFKGGNWGKWRSFGVTSGLNRTPDNR